VECGKKKKRKERQRDRDRDREGVLIERNLESFKNTEKQKRVERECM